MFFENSYLVFKFSVCFFMFFIKNKLETKHVFPDFLVLCVFENIKQFSNIVNKQALDPIKRYSKQKLYSTLSKNKKQIPS